MVAKAYLALDLGTSQMRCIVADAQGHELASASAPWPYRVTEDASPLAREFDVAKTWASVGRCVRSVLKEAKREPRGVAALAVTSQRLGLALLDQTGGTIYAGPNLDLRAVLEGAALEEERGEELYRISGHQPAFLFAPAKLRWWRLHKQEEFSQVRAVLSLADWLCYCFTGELAAEETLAGESGLLDIERRRWALPLLGALGIPAQVLPPLVPCGSLVGTVTKGAAAATGLAQGTPVVTAGADSQCALLGLGVTQPGQVGVVAGWSATLQMVTKRPLRHPERRTWVGCHPLPHRWVVESSAGDAGNVHAWLASLLASHGEIPRLHELAALVEPGSEGVTALLGPEAMDMSHHGLRAGGLLLPVPLTYATIGPGHLMRAALESIAFALQANLEQVEALAEAGATKIAVGGGMSRSSLFCALLANVLGREIEVATAPHSTAHGALLQAKAATGEGKGLKSDPQAWGRSNTTVTPDPLSIAQYRELYQRWQALGQKARSLDDEVTG